MAFKLSAQSWFSRELVRVEGVLARLGPRLYPFYAVVLFLAALLTLSQYLPVIRQTLLWLGPFDAILISGLCVGILLLGFPWSKLGYASFDRITQTGLIWLLGPAVSAAFNGLASLVFPFFIRQQTGQTFIEAALRALHNVGMIMFMILVGGWAFQAAGGQVPVSSLSWDVLFPALSTILAMQLSNGFLLRIRLALTTGRLRLPIDWFANALETAAAGIGLLTVVIAVNNDRILTLAYLFVLLTLIYLVKRLSDSRLVLEERVRERTAQIEAQNRRLEQAKTEQDQLVERLNHLSRTDDLTGLSNRRHINEFMAQERGRVMRYGGEFSVVLLDLDHFKQVNDEFSHQVGDQVLGRVAKIMEGVARSTDLVARYGGEEFLIALPNTDELGARLLVERLRETIEKADWQTLLPGLDITISGGVAQLGPKGNLDELLRQVDSRLYKAKQRGRNRIVAD